MNNEILKVQSIAKQFQELKAVDNLTFTIKRGEIFALLGPNGAGKTTTIRMILGIIKPDSGSIIFCFGQASGASFSKAKLGYLPEDRGLYRDIPIIRTLTYMGILRGLSRSNATSRAREWLERVDLSDRANDKLETLSKGNQQKVQFISAVLHRPEFAVLDEPFAGLDPINQESFIDIIGQMREQGTTIILSAHQMGLVERIADRVLLMNHGRQVLSGTLAEICENSRCSNKIIVRVAPETDITGLGNSPLIQKTERRNEGEYVFYVKKGEPPQKFLLQAASMVELIDFYTEKISLHDIFVETLRRGGDEIAGEVTQ